MARHSTTESTTEDKPATPPPASPNDTPATPPPAPPDDTPARKREHPLKGGDSPEKIQADADKGKPHPHAQIELTQQVTLPTSLTEALATLPYLSQLDGVRANATYYLGAGRDELVKLVAGLPIPAEDKTGLAARDAFVAQAKAGHFTSR